MGGRKLYLLQENLNSLAMVIANYSMDFYTNPADLAII
jgi:hypothetical protein